MAVPVGGPGMYRGLSVDTDGGGKVTLEEPTARHVRRRWHQGLGLADCEAAVSLDNEHVSAVGKDDMPFGAAFRSYVDRSWPFGGRFSISESCQPFIFHENGEG
jgi:hypothetical protein